jgi:hypothetical protein
MAGLLRDEEEEKGFLHGGDRRIQNRTKACL